MTDRTRIARQFIEAIPHSRALGMHLDLLGEGLAVVSMPYDLRFVGDPATGVLHGGAVSALMESDAVLAFNPGHCSITSFELRDGVLQLCERGAQADTRVL